MLSHTFYDSFSVIRGDSRGVKGVGFEREIEKERVKKRKRCRERERLRLNGEGMVTSLRR